MANRPKRQKKHVSYPNTFTETNEIEADSSQASDLENKTYINNSRKRKPFVQYLSLKKYKPKVDKYFK